MSFQNHGLWTAKEAGCINDGDINYDSSSRTELKRSHQWLMDGTEAELFPNKKQPLGVPTTNLFTGMLNTNASAWANTSRFQSVPSSHFAERLFDSESGRTVGFDNRSLVSVSSNTRRKLHEEPYGSDSSFGLSMSHILEDPRSGLNYSGIRKVKVSQVKEAENIVSVSAERAFDRMDANTTLVSNPYDKTDEHIISMGLAYNKLDESIMSNNESYDRENNIYISMGQSYNKGDGHISMSQAYKENDNIIATGHAFSKGDSNFISMGQTYSKAEENTLSIGRIYSKGNGNSVLVDQTCNNDGSSNLSIGQTYNKGESTMISFGSYDDYDDMNQLGKLTCYELLMAQPSLQRSEITIDKELVKRDEDEEVSTAHIAALGTENVSKKKDSVKTVKKLPSNNFPSNVRSLLSTGILDGVPVKYTAWSREKELCGVIKGAGYLCGCQTCKFSKVVNAYEFERHANCKTKHPNNHIYFENGKSIYGIVQELRSTPQSMLFEVIRTITGSPINEKSFRLWKESFLAATRELQRIYGKDGQLL